MIPLMFFFGLYTIDILFVTLLARLGWKAVGFTAIVNMILIGILGGKEIVVFGLHSNIGNIFYAAVIYAVSLVAMKHSFRGTLRLIHAVFFGFVMFVVLSQLAIRFPVVVGNEQVSALYTAALRPSVQILIASFIAFYIGNSINILLLLRLDLPLWGRKIVANIAAQFIDSMFFFLIAFLGHWSFPMIATGLLSGFIMKAILNILDTPLFLYAKNHSPHSCPIA